MLYIVIYNILRPTQYLLHSYVHAILGGKIVDKLQDQKQWHKDTIIIIKMYIENYAVHT